MNGIEITIAVLLLVGIVASWLYTMVFWKDDEQTATHRPVASNALDADFAKDIELFRKARLNLMDPRQLAEAQIAENGPFQISVFAPNPLEEHSPEVYQSTLEWVRRHIHEVDQKHDARNPGELQDAPCMMFWARQSEKTPKMLGIVQRIHTAMKGDPCVFRMFRCVRAPDHLFFFDITLHRYRDMTLKVYVNQRDKKGVTTILQQLPAGHAAKIAEMFSHWLDKAVPTQLEVYTSGSKLFRPQEGDTNLPAMVDCWTVSKENLDANGNGSLSAKSQVTMNKL